MKKQRQQQRVFWPTTAGLVAIFWLGVTLAWANGERQETDFSVEATVRWIVAALGGLVALGGIVVASMNVGAMANVEISVAKKQVSMTRISQGVVIVVVGAAILISGVYFLPNKSHEVIEKAKEITITPDGTRHMRN